MYALYESMPEIVRSPNGLLEAVARTVGVKQGSLLSPTLFGLHVD